jgi:hypothetical protein
MMPVEAEFPLAEACARVLLFVTEMTETKQTFGFTSATIKYRAQQVE